MKLLYFSSRPVLAISLSLLMLAGVPLHGEARSNTYRTGATYSREFRAANADLQTGRYDSAEQRYIALLKKSPNNIQVRSALAVSQAELYKLDAAEKNARTVLAKEGNNAMAHMALGVISRNRTASQDMTYRSQRDNYLTESARQLEMASRLDPKSPEIHNQLGVTYRFQGRLDEALREFQAALRQDPNFAEALVNQGIIMHQKGDNNGAKMAYQRAMKLNSKNPMVHYRLGEAFLNEGDAHLALKSLNTALALNPNNASVITKMGEAYEQQGNVAGAVASYRKAIQSNPSFMPAYMGISNLFDSRGDGELAMAELRSALNVNPKFYAGRNKLGRLALTVDKPDQAVQYYKEALQQNPNDPEALQGLSQALTSIAQKTTTSGNALGSESDIVDAEKHIQEALRLNPNNMRLHLANLRISQLAGKPATSQAELQRIVNAPVTIDSEQMMKGEALLALGRYQEADGIFRGLMDKSGRDADKLLVIGDTLKANGDLDRAKEAYQRVAAVEPGNLKAERGIQRIEKAQAESQKTLRLAKALNNWRQKESSIDFYEETLAKNPRQPEARLALAKLYEKFKYYDKAVTSYQFYLGLNPPLTENERQRYQKKIAKLQQLSQKTNLQTRSY